MKRRLSLILFSNRPKCMPCHIWTIIVEARNEIFKYTVCAADEMLMLLYTYFPLIHDKVTHEQAGVYILSLKTKTRIFNPL